jgi:hypothetical protein
MSSTMNQILITQNVLDDLSKFILTYYRRKLPHPLIIAQKFCLKYKNYGKQFGLPAIVIMVEQLIANNSK